MMQKVDYIIAWAKVSDSEQIASLEKKCFSSPWSVSQIENEILKENVIFLVAKKDDDILGYISGQLIIDEFYISNIAVAEEYRNLKIGSEILKELINCLRNKKCVFATLEVRESNINAIKLYEKFGFTNLGLRRNFYSAPKENAYIYTLFFNEEVN